MLNRPFMFDGNNLQTVLVRDVLKMRKMMIDVFPSIKSQLSSVLDKSGHILKISQLVKLNTTTKMEEQEERMNSPLQSSIEHGSEPPLSPKRKDHHQWSKLQRSIKLASLVESFKTASAIKKQDSGANDDDMNERAALTRRTNLDESKD